MNNEEENKNAEDETNASESTDRNESTETESGEDDYERDESNRGERPDNLRRRSEWFQKRSGGR